jgi:protein-S-isoprenylcysteine O-methyltransferase Ste14
MPNNRIIYWGIVVLVATVLLWIGAELTKRIEWALPYVGGIGVLMTIGGFIYEFWKSRAAKQSQLPPDQPPNQPPGN